MPNTPPPRKGRGCKPIHIPSPTLAKAGDGAGAWRAETDLEGRVCNPANAEIEPRANAKNGFHQKYEPNPLPDRYKCLSSDLPVWAELLP